MLNSVNQRSVRATHSRDSAPLGTPLCIVCTRCGMILGVLHRCNNVLYMRGVPEGDEDGEAKMMET